MAEQALSDLILKFDEQIPSQPVASPSTADTYAVGDVVKINVAKRIANQIRMARIRALDVYLVSDDVKDHDKTQESEQKDESPPMCFIGVEYFTWKPPNDESLLKTLKLFKVKKPGYAGLVTKDQIVGPALWSKAKSKRALRLQHFDEVTFVKAARFGSVPVIRHMMQMTDYPLKDDAAITLRHGRSLNPSAFLRAVTNNHYDVVRLMLDKHRSNNVVDDVEDRKVNGVNDGPRTFKWSRSRDLFRSKDGRTRFYNPAAFDKLCQDSNFKLLELLLVRDRWPVIHSQSHGLYNAVSSGNLPVLKLLLEHLDDPRSVNMPLFRDTKHRTIIPQTNLTLLDTAIDHHHLHIVRFIVSEWKHRDVVIKNRCVGHPSLPHTLPTLLFTILGAHLDHKKYIDFTCDVVECLTAHCDPADLGLNWVSNKRLCDQNITGRDFSSQQCGNEMALCVNSMLCIGSNLAALTYKCQSLWQTFRLFEDEKRGLMLGIRRLITILVQNGMDWNVVDHQKAARNIILRWKSPSWMKVADLNVDICDDQDFVLFFRETVQSAVGDYRCEWLREFKGFYKEDQMMVDIFKWYVLDFVVPRENVLDGLAYFTVKDSKE